MLLCWRIIPASGCMGKLMDWIMRNDIASRRGTRNNGLGVTVPASIINGLTILLQRFCLLLHMCLKLAGRRWWRRPRLYWAVIVAIP